MNTEQVHQGAYVFTIRAAYDNRVGMLARVTSAIGRTGGDIGAIDIIEASKGRMVRDITITARDLEHSRGIVSTVMGMAGVKVIQVADPTFQLHLGGKIEVANRVAVKNRTVLSMVYTPGVGRVSQAIAQDPASVWTLTTKRNAVAVVSDGTAVLGLGDVGPLAALPVMEGKAMLFKELAGVECGPADDRMGLRAEIDALVAHSYGLSEADLYTIFQDFTEAAVQPAYRERVVEKFREVGT